jgi:hypothetical protein
MADVIATQQKAITTEAQRTQREEQIARLRRVKVFVSVPLW